MNLTARGQNGSTGHEEVSGETPDISEYVDFDFYDWVGYGIGTPRIKKTAQR
jgi:hypothetical protein